MTTSRKTRQKRPAPARQDRAAEELEILHPQREFTLAGRALVMREYGFVEGLKLRPLYKAFTDDLYGIFGERMPFDAVLDVFGRHAETVVQLAAIAADADIDWVQSLSPADGNTLLMFWWGVNAGFFTQQLLDRRLIEVQEARARASAGATSTQP